MYIKLSLDKWMWNSESNGLFLSKVVDTNNILYSWRNQYMEMFFVIFIPNTGHVPELKLLCNS